MVNMKLSEFETQCSLIKILQTIANYSLINVMENLETK
jgi:hypothetical protein